MRVNTVGACLRCRDAASCCSRNARGPSFAQLSRRMVCCMRAHRPRATQHETGVPGAYLLLRKGLSHPRTCNTYWEGGSLRARVRDAKCWYSAARWEIYYTACATSVKAAQVRHTWKTWSC